MSVPTVVSRSTSTSHATDWVEWEWSDGWALNVGVTWDMAAMMYRPPAGKWVSILWPDPMDFDRWLDRHLPLLPAHVVRTAAARLVRVSDAVERLGVSA